MLKGDVAVVMLAAFRGMCFLFLVRLRGMVRATSFLKNINCFRQAIARTRGIILLFFARVLTFRALVGWAPSGSRTVPGRPGAPGIGPSKSSSKPTHEDPEMIDLFGLSGPLPTPYRPALTLSSLLLAKAPELSGTGGEAGPPLPGLDVLQHFSDTAVFRRSGPALSSMIVPPPPGSNGLTGKRNGQVV